ncbi:MAG: reverse transcriptase domain-containing protein, partial [Salinivirgaceae bacterium]|nr:reverse transcriptase domain-containing protein [Salinivirgaceae bacterium]
FFKSFFSNKDNVAQHAFYPFIRMVIRTPRFKKTETLYDREKPIRKIVDKDRPLAYAAHFDAFIYSYYSTLLTENYERKAKKWDIYENVIAYLEKGVSNIEFAHEVFEHIKEKGECVAIAFDVSNFFDGLEHEHLKKMWGRVINKPKLPEDHFNVYKSLTEYSFVAKEDLEKVFPHIVTNQKKNMPTKRICEPVEFRERVRKQGLVKSNPFKIMAKESTRFGQKCGIPQGSPISACLSNIYMLEFDIRTKQKTEEINGIYRRYCDDIIVVVDSKDAVTMHQFINDEISRYHLEINETKTETTFFKNDRNGNLRAYNGKDEYSTMQYLGFEFNGSNTYIRSSSMSRYFKRLTARIRENLKAAYGKNAIGDTLFRRKLHNRYTNKGERNFITYAERAARHMNSLTIKKQTKNSMKKVKEKVSKKKHDFEEKRKPTKIMS